MHPASFLFEKVQSPISSAGRHMECSTPCDSPVASNDTKTHQECSQEQRTRKHLGSPLECQIRLGFLLDSTRHLGSICTRLDSAEDASKGTDARVLCAMRPKSNLVEEKRA